MKYITAQILGIAVTLVVLISPQFKVKRHYLMMSVLANSLSLANFFLLEKYSAAGIVVVAIIQLISQLVRVKNEKKPSRAEIILFSALYVAGGTVSNILGGKSFPWEFIDYLPIAGALLFMCAISQNKMQRTRIFLLMNTGVFFVYNAVIRNAQIFAQICAMISLTAALIRYRKKKNSGGEEDDFNSRRKNADHI